MVKGGAPRFSRYPGGPVGTCVNIRVKIGINMCIFTLVWVFKLSFLNVTKECHKHFYEKCHVHSAEQSLRNVSHNPGLRTYINSRAYIYEKVILKNKYMYHFVCFYHSFYS